MIIKMVLNVIGYKDFIKSCLRHGMLMGLMIALSSFVWDTPRTYGQEEVSFSGITEPIKDLKLSLPVEGRIAAIFFEEGAHVNKGQLILELDKRLEVLEAERRKLIWESKAELESARARVQTLKIQLESTRQLFESTKSVSREELEDKELDYRLAVAEQKRLETEEERQRIEYEMALENLRRRGLHSPVRGVIIKLFLREGESCEVGQPLVHLVDAGRGRFVCNVEEKVGRSLSPRKSIDLKIRAGTGSIVRKGTITFVSSVADPASGLVEIKAEFDNTDGAVRPGLEGFMILKAE